MNILIIRFNCQQLLSRKGAKKPNYKAATW